MVHSSPLCEWRMMTAAAVGAQFELASCLRLFLRRAPVTSRHAGTLRRVGTTRSDRLGRVVTAVCSLLTRSVFRVRIAEQQACSLASRCSSSQRPVLWPCRRHGRFEQQRQGRPALHVLRVLGCAAHGGRQLFHLHALPWRRAGSEGECSGCGGSIELLPRSGLLLPLSVQSTAARR